MMPSDRAEMGSSVPKNGEYALLRQQMTDDGQFEAGKLLFHTNALHSWLHGTEFAPITLELDLSLACNDKCPRCVHAFAHNNRFLRKSDVKAILSEAAEYGIRGLTLSGGGEPLSHPDIEEILPEIRKRPFSAGLISNGGLVRSERFAEALVSTFQWIRISLDAASERQFRFVRGVRGLDRRLECLARLVEARRSLNTNCELGVSFLTSSSVVDDIPTVVDLVRSLGFDYVQFKPKINWSEDQHHRSKSLSQAGVFETIQRSLSPQAKDFRVLLSGKKYAPEALCQDVVYSSFHSAWFVAAVGPSVRGPEVNPTLYLDCSAKYLPRWTIAEFSSLTEVLQSEARRKMIENTDSARYCIPPEKHAAYNVQLEALAAKQRETPLTRAELLLLAPSRAKHAFSL